MANYIATCRSNYFKVKDPETFLAAMELIPNIVVDSDNNDETFYILGDDPDGAGWPNWIYDDETGEETEVDLFATVANHLQDGEVAVFMEAGAEKQRYVIGCAVAVNSKGECRTIHLHDIYDIAKAELTDNPTKVTVAEY